jgi:hypothetical protein
MNGEKKHITFQRFIKRELRDDMTRELRSSPQEIRYYFLIPG